MALSSHDKMHLKKFIKQLQTYKGRHTELVSVYVPQGYDIIKIINHLSQEQGTATNIKSSATRKNVIDSLEKMMQHLRLFKRTPANGLCVFAGNVAEREGQQDFQVFSIEPPNPINIRIYRCDKEFVLDPLVEMADDSVIYGLIVMDRREGDVALLKGKTIIPVTKSTSNVPGKSRAGGQSAMRFERLRDIAAAEFYGRIAEHAKDAFLMDKEVKGIIVGGPGQTKYDFVNGGFLTGDIQKKIIAIKDLSYTGDFGLQELVDKCEDVLSNEEIMTEKKIMGKFFEMLARTPRLVSYGEAHVRKCIEMGMADTILLSEELEEGKIEEFESIAKNFGSTIVIISTETREGVQLRDLGKVGAILRYELHE